MEDNNARVEVVFGHLYEGGRDVVVHLGPGTRDEATALCVLVNTTLKKDRDEVLRRFQGIMDPRAVAYVKESTAGVWAQAFPIANTSQPLSAAITLLS